MNLKWRSVAFQIWALPLFAITPFCAARTVSFQNFSSTAGLILQVNAASANGHLRLTPAIAGRGLGGAWLETKQPVKNGFETTFQIQITEKYSSGGDGMAFVIQGGAKPGVGLTGGELGFGGITNQFAVHFKNYHWGDHPTDGRYDEIAVLAASSPMEPLRDAPENFIGSVSRRIDYSDGAVHTVKILYVPGNLQVFLDDLANPLMTVYVNLAKLMNLDEGRAWVGFTGSGGADWQNQDVVSWSFISNDQAPRLSGVMAPLDSNNAPGLTLPNRLFSTPSLSTPETTPLSVDHAFGYSVPPGIELAYQIEASTNLVSWTPLTNPTFYFRDHDSTNSAIRFYRFVPK